MYFGPQVQKLTDKEITGDGHSEKDFLENWIVAYIPIRIPKKTSECPSLQITSKRVDIFQYSLSFT